MVRVARYGLSQSLPGRATGQVGAITTSPEIPESFCGVAAAVDLMGNPRPTPPEASTATDASAAATAPRRLLTTDTGFTPWTLSYGVDTSITRVPQSLMPSTVWLDFGGTYSVASQTDFPPGSMTAQE